MALRVLLACVVASAAAGGGQRWSRQVAHNADISDWVPLTGPVQKPDPPKPTHKRQIAEPRILAEPAFAAYRPTGFDEPIPPRNYYTNNNNNKLYLQGFPAVPSAPQNYLSDNGFGHIRFGVGQPNNPLNQGFITSQFTFPHEVPPVNQIRPAGTVSFPKVPVSSPPAKPFGQFPQYMKPPSNKFVDSYRPEVNQAPKKKPVAPNNDKIKAQSSSERFPINKPKVEREEVQLLYVPADALNQGPFNFKNSIAQQVFNPNVPQQAQVRQNFDTRPKITDSFGPEYYSGFNAGLGGLDQTRYSTNASPFPQPVVAPTTPKPKKLKPHQPPLAIFITDEARKGNQVKVGDVLSFLKSSNTIAVLDSVNPQNSPKVFIGPNNLNTPSHYVKFEVPYLSNIEHTDKKLRQLPFFVAPLSYHTPQGFAKIPFPSPHVGSVIINAQVKDNSQLKALQPQELNTAAPPLKQEQRPATQPPNLTYYTTSGPRNHPPTYDKQYYSFEPQTVSTLRPAKELKPAIVTVPPGKSETYYVNNGNNDYHYTNDNLRGPETEKVRETPRTSTTTTTTAAPSTYPSRLLETHNPYSINQAFHLSTPLDYQKYYDEYKEGYPGYNLPIGSTSPGPSSSPASEEPQKVPEKQTYQTPPAYTQNYSPEVQFESEVPNSRYTYNNNKGSEYNAYNTNNNKQKVVFNTDPYKSQSPNQYDNIGYVPQVPANVQQYSQEVQTLNRQSSQEYTYSSETPEQTHSTLNNAYSSVEVSSANPPSSLYTETYPTPGEKENSISLDSLTNAIAGGSTETTYSNEAVTQATQTNYGDYSYSSEETPKTSTSTTTTRRTPLRSRGRPRYTTSRNNDNTETTTRAYATRRPISRRPLPTRAKPEVTRATTEKPTRKSESNENSTKSPRGRIRGRVQYKPTESDESYDRRHQKHGSKENDLAYQRDVLHQNYPVTLSERVTAHDVDYVTEPLPRFSSSKSAEDSTQIYDSIDANTNEKAALDFASRLSSKEDSVSYSSKTETQTEYIPKSSQWEEYTHSRSSTQAQAIDAISYDDLYIESEVKQTTPLPSKEIIETVTETNYAYSTVEEPKAPSNVAYAVEKIEDTTAAEIVTNKPASQEVSTEAEAEFNVVQTTPSFSRVRVRPGVVRQYHQASTTTNSPRVKGERRRPQQAVTYRPAFDRQRTTMRIEEIQQDLKTKQVLVRPEQNYKYPVYKPEPSTAAPLSTTEQDVATKRTPNFRRRRPSYTTSTTEPSKQLKERRTELQGRFRGRRPTTEKTVKEPEVESTTQTIRNYDRKSSRLKLSDRFQKKTVKEDNDQEIDDSINRPRFVSPNNKFTPIVNPNLIYEDNKGPTTERRSDFILETDIITASNDDYGDILLSVTPPSNNKGSRVLADLSPTLEALVEKSNSNSTGSDGTFETMLQDVMRSIEKMDHSEYNSTVMKLKDGEIGEIPPEKTFPEEYPKSTTLHHDEYSTDEPIELETKEETSSEKPRRGYWKKVKVRPIANDPLEFAESQYYTSTVNKLGDPVGGNKLSHDKSYAPTKIAVTTYKPAFQFLSSLFEPSADDIDVIPDVDIPKINPKVSEIKPTTIQEEQKTTVPSFISEEVTYASPGQLDLGTGSPDPTISENMYYNTPTEPSASDRTDALSFMDYLFGITAKESSEEFKDTDEKNSTTQSIASIKQEVESITDVSKPKLITTDSSYVPEEVLSETTTETNFDVILDEIKKLEAVELKSEEAVTSTSVEKTVVRVETASESSFMDKNNVMSTSMSTEISHETEICFRGKCIKSSKDLL